MEKFETSIKKLQVPNQIKKNLQGIILFKLYNKI